MGRDASHVSEYSTYDDVMQNRNLGVSTVPSFPRRLLHSILYNYVNVPAETVLCNPALLPQHTGLALRIVP